MNRRDLSMDKYGISKHMYRELYNFCLQYAEKKTRINSGRWGFWRVFQLIFRPSRLTQFWQL